MNKVFNRWLPGATLLVWSGILLFFYFSGRIAPLLHPSFRIGVLLAGVVMAAFGLAFVFLPKIASCCDNEFCGHPLGRAGFGRILTFLILLLPVTTAATFSPNNFSATTIANRGIVTDAHALPGKPPSATSQFVEPPLPTKDGSPAAPEQSAAASEYLPKDQQGNVQVAVIDLLYAAQDLSLRSDFENKKIELIGQTMPDNVSNASGKRFKLVRMLMTCCAADARPIAVLVEDNKLSALPEMSWVKVVGTAEFKLENGRTLAMVKADSVSQTEPPAEAMLY